LFAVLARAAEQRVGEFNEQELANIAWAFARAGQSDAQLLTALARVAERLVRSFKAQGIGNVVWAFAKLG